MVKSLVSIYGKIKSFFWIFVVFLCITIIICYKIYLQRNLIDETNTLYENEIECLSYIKESNSQMILSLSDMHELDAYFNSKSEIKRLSNHIRDHGQNYIKSVQNALRIITTEKDKESSLYLLNLFETIHTMQLDMAEKLKSNGYDNAESLRLDSREIRKFTERARVLVENLSQRLEKSAEHRVEVLDVLNNTMVHLYWGLIAAVAFCGILFGLSIATSQRHGAFDGATQMKPIGVLTPDEKQWLTETFAQEQEASPLNGNKKNVCSPETRGQDHTAASSHSRGHDS